MRQRKVPYFLETAFTKDFVIVNDGMDYSFYCEQIGFLSMKEGNVIACDPFLFYENKPFEEKFPVGKFPVELAIAKINDDERIGFARVKFTSSLPVNWSIAVTIAQDASDLADADILGYGVDSGAGCFMDTSGANRYLEFLKSKEDNYLRVIEDMEKNYCDTRSWLLWEMAGDNVAMFSSGWGDGLYATYIGYDDHGAICRLVTDFNLLSWPS
ncbi:MAG TPA: DUF4241 domain-containing protein [Sphingobacteriaceae bacterium]